MRCGNDEINDYGIGMVSANFNVLGKLVAKHGEVWERHAKCNIQGTRILESYSDPRVLGAKLFHTGFSLLFQDNFHKLALHMSVVKTYLSFQRIIGSELSDAEVADWSNRMHDALKYRIFPHVTAVKREVARSFHYLNYGWEETLKRRGFYDGKVYRMDEGVFEEGYRVYQLLKRRQRVIDLHDTANHPAPESALKKLAHEEALDRQEEIALKEWIEGLNLAATANRSFFQELLFSGRNLNSRRLHKMLREFLGEEEHLLPYLEVCLKEEGLWVLDQKDRKQAELRDQWREKLMIDSKGGKVRLEKEIREDPLRADDRREVYAFAEDPGKVAVIYWNQALGWMEIAEQAKKSNLLPWPKAVSVDTALSDPKGKFFVMERIDTTLSSVQWGGGVTKEKWKRAEALAEALAKWVEYQAQPKRLKASDFGWLADGTFVSARAFSAVPLAYTKLLPFIEEAAQGTCWVMQQLISQSKLDETIEARYFKTLLEKKGDPLRVLQILSKDFAIFKDKDLAEKGDAFLQRLSWVERRVIDALNRECVIEDIEKMKEEIRRETERFFSFTLCYGIVPESCFHWVHQEALKTGRYRYTDAKLEEKICLLEVRKRRAPDQIFNEKFFHEEGIFDPVMISQIRGRILKTRVV